MDTELQICPIGSMTAQILIILIIGQGRLIFVGVGSWNVGGK
jgi:hypothetical protein